MSRGDDGCRVPAKVTHIIGEDNKAVAPHLAWMTVGARVSVGVSVTVGVRVRIGLRLQLGLGLEVKVRVGLGLG